MQPEYVGALAQSVEQQTENLCVPGSIPGGTTKLLTKRAAFFINKVNCQMINSNFNQNILLVKKIAIILLIKQLLF